MHQILVCIEGNGVSGICPSGYIPQVFPGYILTYDPSFFDASKAAQFFSLSFCAVVGLYLLSKNIGTILQFIKNL